MTGSSETRPLLALYQPVGYCVLRTPLRPFSAFRSLGENIRDALGAPEDAFAAALESDRARTTARLADALRDQALLGAIGLASPSLERSIGGWRLRPEDRAGRKTERALVRYAIRAATRPTPFGCFAGLSIGQLAEATVLQLGPEACYRRTTRVDLAWLTELFDAIACDPDLRSVLTFIPNPTMYSLPERWRYIARRVDDGHWAYSVRQVRSTPALVATLERARKRATLPALSGALIAEGRDPERARAFVERLAMGQVLVADLAPAVTGLDSLEALARRLAPLPTPASRAAAAALREAHARLRAIDRSSIGAIPGGDSEARAVLARAHRPRYQSALLHGELHKPARLTLGPSVLTEISRAVEALRSWGQPVEDKLEAFREAFVRRYGGQQVPLMHALDEDVGVGLPTPDARAGEPPWGEREQRLLAALQEVFRLGEPELVLDADRERPATAPLPRGLMVSLRLAARDAAAVDRGEFRLVFEFAEGPNTTRLLGRFSGEPALFKLVHAHLEAEERLDNESIYAEIADLPHPKLAAAIQRPVLRRWEIELLGPSGAPHERRIRLEDLLVSVHDGCVELHRRQDHRRVVPALSSAVGLEMHVLPVFNFLGWVSRQHVLVLRFDWGALDSAPFLPRVRSGRVVFSLARWRLAYDELEELRQGSDRRRFEAAAELRGRRRLPRMVSIVEHGDNALAVDLETTLGVETFLSLLKQADAAILEEVFPGPDDLCVEGPRGRFAHQLLVPFIARPGTDGRLLWATRRRAASKPRRYVPGSNWLDARLVCGASTGTRLLRDRLAPLCRKLIESGVATTWFFLRTSAPQPGVRVVVGGHSDDVCERGLPTLAAASETLMRRLEGGRLTVEQYERDLERWGGPTGVLIAERWWHADSEASVTVLRSRSSSDALALAVCAAERGLIDLGLSAADRATAVQVALHEVNDGLLSAVPRDYAGSEPALPAKPIVAMADELGDIPTLIGAYDAQRETWTALADELGAADRSGELEIPGVTFAGRLLRTRVNRLLGLPTHDRERLIYSELNHRADLLREQGSGPWRVDT